MNANAVEKETPAEEFLTSRKLAERLNTDVRTIERWVQRDWLPYYRIGRVLRFKWSEVEVALQQISRTSRK